MSVELSSVSRPFFGAGDTSSPAVVDRFVGSSAAAAAVRNRLAAIARSDAPVLIQGASGTGKELAARIVHDLSSRADGPFVAVDGGALVDSLVETELFGHVRGAFTGAASNRPGLFEEANGGTLFLDEIGNASLALQARLLRVLETREVRPVGANKPRAIDVRVIAASNCNLADEVVAGRFRDDLRYRLDVLRVHLPLLRDRREDIPAIARRLLERIGERTRQTYRLTAEAAALLTAYDWPGNVRELGNGLEEAAALSADGLIDADRVLHRYVDRVGAEPPHRSLADRIAEFERCVLVNRLEANGWSRAQTARELGISRRCLFNKIRTYGLRPNVRSCASACGR